MDTRRHDDSSSFRSTGVSRRQALLHMGTGGLVAALFAGVPSLVKAQEATPSPAGGMPPGVSIAPVTTVPILDMPPGTVDVTIYRIIHEPGADAPISTFPFPGLVYVEEGTLVCPGGAPRYHIAADGTVQEVGDGDVTVNTGEALYVPANVPDGARNEGTGMLTILAVDFVPAEDRATPTA